METPPATARHDIRLRINGEAVSASLEPRTHLADYLREARNLTGTHLGCEHGVCGACTVEMDGVPVRSCITFAAACDGVQVRTIEGFDDDPVMAALRAAFSRHHALQCGYCTPGMLITAHDIVRRLPDADEARIREELSGNLCRCTGYAGIVEAIRDVLASAPADAGLAGSASAQATVAPTARTSMLPRAEAHGRSTATAPPAATGDGHRINVAAPPDAVWRVLRDPATAVGCMPGAELIGPPDASPLRFRMTAAIGPMRAAFEGEATLHYDDAQRSGSIDGQGKDSRSRSEAHGKVAFAVSPAGNGSELAVDLDYTIQGPLAQFSRGAVVDAVVEQLMQRFAGNVAAATRGEDVSGAPAGGISLVFAALVRKVRSWLGL